jgi:hypothetical protein
MLPSQPVTTSPARNSNLASPRANASIVIDVTTMAAMARTIIIAFDLPINTLLNVF